MREENIHIVVNALAIPRVGQIKTLLLRVQQQFLRFQFFIEDGPDGQRVGHLPERGLNGFFVIGDFNFLADFRYRRDKGKTGCLENWQAN